MNALALQETMASGTATVPCGTLQISPLQPVEDVRAYLKERAQNHAAVADWRDEERLAIRLPTAVRAEMRAMFNACCHVLSRVGDGASVQAACKAVLANFKRDGWHWNLTTFRQKFDAWRTQQDWVVLVNKARAGGGWIDRDDTKLPDAFLNYAETRCGAFRRRDAMRQAIISLQRQWKTGRNHEGNDQPIDGYVEGWESRDRENIPAGWSEDNIRDQIKERARLTKAVRALLNEGEAAAREHLPQVIGTKSDLRFLEEITFDDVRFDYLILNEETGLAEELWALVAREQSCRLVLGGVLFPASIREDGKASHLGAQQMKELAGYLLQTYPLPPYVMKWIVERGTATLRLAVALAMGELFDHRIKVSYTSMIGGESPVGYVEKKKGNSRGKGSHESHNRLYHTQGSFVPGQTGSHYGIRPGDLKARCDEAESIWQQTRDLPGHLRARVEYPLLTLRKAREYFNKFSLDQNFRTAHKIEGFEKILEVWNGQRWIVSDTAAPGAKLRERVESPVERAARKIREVETQFGANCWTRPSPEVVCAFLDHSQRRVVVNAKGRIQIDHEGRALTFEHGGVPLKSNTVALAYHHADNPEFLHLTDGEGRILGTWLQVDRVGSKDRDALARALRRNHAALAEAKACAQELAAPQIASLESMRRHNEELQNFITVTDAPASVPDTRHSSLVTRHLASAATIKASVEKEQAEDADYERIAREALNNLNG